MNIFLLDKPCDISTIAQSHCDKHVSKMILESAQMLCTASWLSGITASYGFLLVNKTGYGYRNLLLSLMKNFAGVMDVQLIISLLMW